MLAYKFENSLCYPTKEAIVIADSKEEALEMIEKETRIKIGWTLLDEYADKKGIIFYGESNR